MVISTNRSKPRGEEAGEYEPVLDRILEVG